MDLNELIEEMEDFQYMGIGEWTQKTEKDQEVFDAIVDILYEKRKENNYED